MRYNITMALPPAPLGVPEFMWKEELRNAKHVAVPEQLMDAGGVLLGIYFLADGLHRGAVINTVLGGIMAWIHGHRFIVGDQIDVRSLLR